MLQKIRCGRERLFGDGRPVPMDRNAKVRIMVLARAKLRRDAPGRHYGSVTAKAYAVLEALLWGFHNARTGLCFPSYETIASRAGCARSTVALAIKSLEAAGVLTWCNRLRRMKALGPAGWRWRVLRTSNGYRFTDLPATTATSRVPRDRSKSDLPSGTTNQVHFSMDAPSRRDLISSETPLEAALERLRHGLHKRQTTTPIHT